MRSFNSTSIHQYLNGVITLAASILLAFALAVTFCGCSDDIQYSVEGGTDPCNGCQVALSPASLGLPYRTRDWCEGQAEPAEAIRACAWALPECWYLPDGVFSPSESEVQDCQDATSIACPDEYQECKIF